MGFETPTPPEAQISLNTTEQPKPVAESIEGVVNDQSKTTELETEDIGINQENLSPEEAAAKLFALMDEMQETCAISSNKARTIEQITQLLREASKTKDPKSHRFFRESEHFKRLKITNKYSIENSLDRDLHARIITYFNSIGIEVTEDEQAEIIRYFRERDEQKKRDAFNSYAENGLLTLKSGIEKGVLKESSSTPGDFSSLDDLQEFSVEEHGNIRGYELSPQDINNELFYGRNSFFVVVLERGGEEIDRASKLPKGEVQNRLKGSMIFVIKSEKVGISRRTDNVNKEDIVRRDIRPEEIDYLIVDHSNFTSAQEAFGHLPCRIISADTVEAELQNFFNGPYKLPDYKGEIEKIAKKEGRIWCHIARLPVDTYPEE